MTSKSKYMPLFQFLSAGLRQPITLTFAQVRVLVPDIAQSHDDDNRWWTNDDPSHSHCRAWGDAGFSAHANIARRQVTFRPHAA